MSIKALSDPNMSMIKIGPDGELTDIKNGDRGGLVLEDTSRRVRVEPFTQSEFSKMQQMGL